MKTKEVAINFIKKFKLESITIVAISLFAAFIVEIAKMKSEKIFEILIILLFIAMGSFLVDKVLAIYEDSIKQKIIVKSRSSDNLANKYLIIKITFYVIVVLIEYLLYKLSIYLSVNLGSAIKYIDDSNPDMMAAGFFLVSMIIVPLISYFVIKEKNINMKSYLLKVFVNSLFIFVIECVAGVGFLVLCFVYEGLLGDLPYFIVSKIIIFTITLITVMGFFLSIENVEGEHSLFAKILVRYIMQIMVIAGFVIFYIYLARIIIKFELPSNEVYSVCATLFMLGLPISLMSLGISEESTYNKLIKYLPIAFLPALILQIISLFIRINRYGITTTRYVGLIFIMFETIYLVIYILDEILQNKKVKLENIFLVFCIMILVLFYVPKINVYEFPEICNSIFKA